ncbi:MAG: hypothetical protein RBG13Loki_4020 [Promethearchaeota archaeon CR_4]|nr:MAG: hypothetical protein RBG13Loki_4020 [Candidatus Lokiarchaeota archaeon CR_4]
MLNDRDPRFTSGLNPLRDTTEVRSSPVSGLGLFAKRLLPRGTIWWHARFQDLLLITQSQYEILTTSVQSPMTQSIITGMLTYSYYLSEFDALVICLDNSRFCNHSYTPNSGYDPTMNPFMSVTTRDIAAGEEIFEDYTTYDKCPWADLKDEFLKEVTKPTIKKAS